MIGDRGLTHVHPGAQLDNSQFAHAGSSLILLISQSMQNNVVGRTM